MPLCDEQVSQNEKNTGYSIIEKSKKGSDTVSLFSYLTPPVPIYTIRYRAVEAHI